MSYERIYKMPFATLYDALRKKAEKKGRNEAEVNRVICWMTGYDEAGLKDCLQNGISYRDFFQQAPELNEKRHKITGKICGIVIQEMKNPLDKDIRYLDKLIDDLTKGKDVPAIYED